MRLPAFVYLSICLSVSKITQNACMDLHEMLRVDRFGTWRNWLTFEPDPDHSPDAGTGLAYTFSDTVCTATREILLRRENPTYRYWAWLFAARRVVLWRRKTVVGGKCVLPSAILVHFKNCRKKKRIPGRRTESPNLINLLKVACSGP